MFSFIRLHIAVISIVTPAILLPGRFSNVSITVAGKLPASSSKTFSEKIAEKYSAWQLQNEGISPELFSYAMKGYEFLKQHNQLGNPGVISIIDFSKRSDEKRLFILDINSGQILFKTLVAHGRNSGMELAKTFSNVASSLASSLGFYVTAGTYNGKHGYSLRLNGCEKGFNDNACKRAVVVHGADYVSESFIHQNGYLGRSYGCPAVPAAFSKDIIDIIKGGSCLFIYAPSAKYLQQSAMLKS